MKRNKRALTKRCANSEMKKPQVNPVSPKYSSEIRGIYIATLPAATIDWALGIAFAETRKTTNKTIITNTENTKPYPRLSKIKLSKFVKAVKNKESTVTAIQKDAYTVKA